MTTNGKILLAAVLSMAVLVVAPPVRAESPAPVSVPPPVAAESPHEWYGTVRDVHGPRFQLTLRSGRVLVVEQSTQLALHHGLLLFAGRPVIVKGSVGAGGLVHADVVLRSHAMPAYWPPDH